MLVESATKLRRALARMVQAGGSALDMVTAVRMEIRFDLSIRKMSDRVPDLELAVYDCVVEIVDDRGKRHVVQVEEWWRY